MDNDHSMPRPASAMEDQNSRIVGPEDADNGGISPATITAEIETMLPEEDGMIVYSHAGPTLPGEAGTGIMALRASIRNTSSFAIRLTQVRFDLLAENNGILSPAGPQILFAASEIGSDGVTDVFGQTNPDGPQISPGDATDIHIQKIQSNNCRNVFFEEGTVDRVRLTFRFAAGGLQEDVVVVREVRPATNDNGTAAGSYLYPMKARDLRPGEHWAGNSGTNNSHHKGNERNASDAGCRFVDTEGGPASGTMPGTNGAWNLDYRYFARPIYAMADGVVEAIQRNRPDNLPGCKTDASSANKVEVRHGNEIARYLHLMRWSIDPSLEVGDSVSAGQFLGLGGNSGSSTSPHLHIDVLDAATRTLRPLHFRDLYTIAVDKADPQLSLENWVELDGNALPAVNKSTGLNKNLLWPSREKPRNVERGVDSGNSGSEIADLAPVALGPNVVVTAARMTENNRLRLFSYEIDGSDISLLDDSGNQAGVVQEFAAEEVAQGLIAVAARTNGGRLKVIAWERSSDGSLARVSDSGNQAGLADLMCAASFEGGRLITGLRTESGKEKHVAWDVTPDEITRLGDSTVSEDEIDRLSISPVGPSSVVSCARNGASGKFRLRLQDWSDDGTGAVLIADSGSSTWSVDEISVLGLGPDIVVTATNDTKCNRLNLTAWTVDGDELRPIGDAGSQGDKIDAAEVASLTDLGNQCFAVGLSDSSGTARVSVWCVEPDYGSITMLGNSGSLMGKAKLATVVSTARDRIICAAKTESDKQKLIEFSH